MKNNKLILTITLTMFAMLGLATDSLAVVGELLEVPGRVVEGTGRAVAGVGRAITPGRTRVHRTVVREPVRVTRTGEVVEVDETVTPSEVVETTAPIEPGEVRTVETVETRPYVKRVYVREPVVSVRECPNGNCPCPNGDCPTRIIYED